MFSCDGHADPDLSSIMPLWQGPSAQFAAITMTHPRPLGRAWCGSGRTTMALGRPMTWRWASPFNMPTRSSTPGSTSRPSALVTSSTSAPWARSTGRPSASAASAAVSTSSTPWSLAPCLRLSPGQSVLASQPPHPLRHPAPVHSVSW